MNSLSEGDRRKQKKVRQTKERGGTKERRPKERKKERRGRGRKEIHTAARTPSAKSRVIFLLGRDMVSLSNQPYRPARISSETNCPSGIMFELVMVILSDTSVFLPYLPRDSLR